MAKGRDDQEFNSKLVKAVEKHPCLYNYVLPEYSRKNVTENAWDEVANEVHEKVTTCKEKWKNIRTVFVRKLKSELNGKFKKPYYLNDRLQFVVPFVKPNTVNAEALGNLPSPPPEMKFSESDDETDDFNVDIEDEVVEETKPEQTNTSGYQGTKRKFELAEAEDPFKEFGNQRTYQQDENDPRYMFLMSLLPEINELNEYQMRRFKRRVLALIDDVLAENSVSTMPSTSTLFTSTPSSSETTYTSR